MSPKKSLRQLIKRAVFGGERLPNLFFLAQTEPQQEVVVWLLVAGKPIDVTRRHCQASGLPFTLCIEFTRGRAPSESERSQVKLRLCENGGANRVLSEIDLVYRETLDDPVGIAMLDSIGNLVDRAVTFATLVHGGVMDAHPDLKVVLGHGGGYTCYGIGRMDHAWQVRSEARAHIGAPPSTYLRRFYYDCIVYTEPALRFLIDTVGVDRVLFGTDWPYDMALDWPVAQPGAVG